MFTPPGGRRKKQPLAGGKHRGVVPPGVQRIAQASPGSWCTPGGASGAWVAAGVECPPLPHRGGDTNSQGGVGGWFDAG